MYKKATVSINELETNKADYYIVSALVKQRIHNRYSLIQDKLYILVCHPLPMKGEVALVLQYIYVAPKSCTQSFKKLKIHFKILREFEILEFLVFLTTHCCYVFDVD